MSPRRRGRPVGPTAIDLQNPEHPGMLSTQDFSLKRMDVKPVLASRNLVIGGD